MLIPKSVGDRVFPPMNEEEWNTYLALANAGPRSGPQGGQVLPPPWQDGGIFEESFPRSMSLLSALQTLFSTRRSTSCVSSSLGQADIFRLLALALARPEQGAPFRSYPTSGGCDELGILVVARNVQGLAEGAYWANMISKRKLSYAASLDENYHAFERLACLFLGEDLPAAALLLIFADWQRLTRRYASCVLASALWDAGALLQTLQLSATALAINSCAVACVQPRLVEAWLHLDCQRVGQVGLLALGGAPKERE